MNRPLINFAPFYKAFDAKPGEKNYKPISDFIKIWSRRLSIAAWPLSIFIYASMKSLTLYFKRDSI